jgi:hypothetical protein
MISISGCLSTIIEVQLPYEVTLNMALNTHLNNNVYNNNYCVLNVTLNLKFLYEVENCSDFLIVYQSVNRYLAVLNAFLLKYFVVYITHQPTVITSIKYL